MSTGLYNKFRVLWLQPYKVGGQAVRAMAPMSPMAVCCEDMRTAIDFSCDQHADPFECPDFLVAYNAIVDEYGLPIRDGGASVLTIRHCPFCGARLPDSKLDRWFDELEALGFTGPFDETIPEAYRSDAWWRTPAKQKDR